ncbi:polysaccharide deacetylase family protein [Rhodopila sp.]|jgi:peptidoglycan/xylan/chitin deacetylase (PgdA/CDA1 family)|uniref:polysaccharide deacetylase family protein n=1 Tax=Rhodopila sp. TaxID=2480087 RepID=UPI002BCDC94C|nr:polysaccharide deacetylase family protein [Rhodopila sp.]HVZ07049.1 polysaccharide deacetylase family protein [Rhodopila sp.]
MPWKQGYTVSDERTIPDEDVRWPDGHRCCVGITVDLSVAPGPEGIRPANLRDADAFFALHDGLEEILDVLRRHAFRATFAVPAVIAEVARAMIPRILAAGHEIAANGFRHEDVSHLSRAEEAARIAAATEVLARVTGQRPRGWYALPRQGDPFAGGTISPHTMDLLLEAGYDWFGNGLADDIPHYWVTDFAARRAILALPYYYHFDDQFFLMFPRQGTGLEHADSLARNWRAEFEAQYRRGRHFCMTLHPQGSGWCHRAELLDRFLAHMRSFPDIWNPTASACAAWWQATYPAATHLRLEPSIWTDHPGSLS